MKGLKSKEMKINKWTPSDLIDLEYFLKLDEEAGEDMSVKKRDREIYLSLTGGKDTVSPFILIRMWLSSIREIRKNDQTLSPGRIYDDTMRLLGIFFTVTGFIAGVSLCSAFFTYTGQNPLNVSYFLAITLFPQFFFLMLLFGLGIYVKTGSFSNSLKDSFFNYLYIGRLIDFLIHIMAKKAHTFVSAQKREKTAVISGMFRAAHKVYGTVFFWPLFILTQLLGTGFYLAVLLSTIFRVVFFDTAFGWQSTIQLSAQGVHRIVSFIAMPWSWFLPETAGFPSLDQIEGSRMILKEGIFHLTTGDLVAWWPFLCLAIFFYGLLPRVLLLGSGYTFLVRSLKNLNFDHGTCNGLLRRMTRPLVTTNIRDFKYESKGETPISSPPLRDSHVNIYSDAGTASDAGITSDTGIASGAGTAGKNILEPALGENSGTGTAHVRHEQLQPASDGSRLPLKKEIQKEQIRACLGIVPGDIYEDIDLSDFQKIVKNSLGFDMKGVMEIGLDFDQLLGEIKDYLDHNIVVEEPGDTPHKNVPTTMPVLSIILLQEAWQPPIREMIQLLKEIRKTVGNKFPLIIVLVGKPYDGNFFTPVDEVDWKVWKMKATEIGDPYLSVEKLVTL